MEKITIEFEKEELEQLLYILWAIENVGPLASGWKSNELMNIIRKLESALRE